MAYILAVAGLGRCGSTVVMQMLAAAGVPTIGTFPDYEDQRMIDDRTALYGEAYLKAQQSPLGVCAVKHLEPVRWPPPDCYPVKWLLLTRNPKEQARSMLKLLRNAGHKVGNSAKQVQGGIVEDTHKLRATLTIGQRVCEEVTFEHILKKPTREAVHILRFALGKNPSLEQQTAAAGMVVRRSPNCLPYMLEEVFLKMAEQSKKAGAA